MSAVKSKVKKALTVKLPASKSLEAGDRVVVDKDKVGQILWVGSDRLLGVGAHYGVRLLEKRGTNDGSFRGKRFFHCPKGYGLIVRRIRIKKLYKGEEFDFTKDLEPTHSEEETASVSLADGSSVSGQLASERSKKRKVLRTKAKKTVSTKKSKTKKTTTAKKSKTASGGSLKKKKAVKKKWKSKASKVLIVEMDVAAEHIYLLCAFWFRKESVESSSAKAAQIPADIVSMVRRFLHKVILGRASVELKQALELGHADVLRMLHAKGDDILSKAPCCKNCDALYYACKTGKMECIDVLLKSGADPCGKQRDGMTNLMALVGFGDLEAVKKFLALGCDPNATTRDGSTALIFASAKGHFELVKLFVEVGCDLEAKGAKLGLSAFNCACVGGHFEVAEYLLSVGADLNSTSRDMLHMDAVCMAAYSGNTALIQWLVEHGADVSKKNMANMDALQFAALAGHLEAAQFMVDHFFDGSLKGESGLELMINIENLKAIKVLIAVGADVNAVFDGGKTVLMHAAKTGRLDIVELLVGGCDILAIDEDGRDAVEYARMDEHWEVADFLTAEKERLSAEPIAEVPVELKGLDADD